MRWLARTLRHLEAAALTGAVVFVVAAALLAAVLSGGK